MGSTSRRNPYFALKICTTKEITVMICHMHAFVHSKPINARVIKKDNYITLSSQFF